MAGVAARFSLLALPLWDGGGRVGVPLLGGEGLPNSSWNRPIQTFLPLPSFHLGRAISPPHLLPLLGSPGPRMDLRRPMLREK